MSTTATRLQSALRSLPENASEALVDSLFAPYLLKELGFQAEEIHPQYNTGNGKVVDKAARKTIGDDIFLHTKSNPHLLVELKGRSINLSENAVHYQKTVNQLKTNLLAPNCHATQWGIITNSYNIQLFRKHGRVIFPVTKCISLNEENIDEVITSIRRKIDSPNKGLTVAVYNNKGGVGKTTTTVNLAGIFTCFGKRVLAIDLDPNQQDLTNSLGLSFNDGKLYEALTERDIPLRSAVQTYVFRSGKQTFKFDVITADLKLTEKPDHILSGEIQIKNLHYKIKILKQEYDYILIDSPPNWKLFSKLSLYAADAILIPTKHNNLFSLENAATAIKKFIPEVQAIKNDGSPIALPIFFNGEKITQPQLIVAQKEINNIIEAGKNEKIELLPYFYPKHTDAHQDRHVHQLPNYANIASAAFARVPAVYQNRFALEYYKNLAKEYFLQ